MKRLCIVWLGVWVLASSLAYGGEGSYVGVRAGSFELDDSAVDTGHSSYWYARKLGYDSGRAYGLFAGAREGRFRLEGELMHRSLEVTERQAKYSDFGERRSWEMTGDLALTTVLLNGYMNLFSMGPVTPYLGVGVGAARHEMEGVRRRSDNGEGIDGDDLVFAFQYGGGIDIAFHKSVTLEIAWRHLGMEDPRIGKIRYEIEGENVMVGVRCMY